LKNSQLDFLFVGWISCLSLGAMWVQHLGTSPLLLEFVFARVRLFDDRDNPICPPDLPALLNRLHVALK
jgi:hypothetical protein